MTKYIVAIQWYKQQYRRECFPEIFNELLIFIIGNKEGDLG